MKLRKPLVLRDEILGVLRAPIEIRSQLLRVGGYTPFGEAMYRLEWAENIYDEQGGRWEEWPEEMPVHLRCYPRSPVRVVVEMRQVLKYPGLVGWVLERWQPVAYYGGKEAWEQMKVPGTDLPMLGPLNAAGRYELVAGPSVEMPSLLDLKNAIEECEWAREMHSGAVDRAVRERVNEAIYQYEEEGRKLRERTEQMVKDALSPWNHASLGAGRWRSEQAEKLGIREHAGN